MGKVLPIEIKSEKDYEKHSALDHILDASEYEIDEAFIFSNENVKVNGKEIYYPIYMLMFLKEDSMEFADISVDRFRL